MIRGYYIQDRVRESPNKGRCRGMVRGSCHLAQEEDKSVWVLRMLVSAW